MVNNNHLNFVKVTLQLLEGKFSTDVIDKKLNQIKLDQQQIEDLIATDEKHKYI
jgi:hypothetical protein